MKVLIAVRSKTTTRQLASIFSQYEIHTCHTDKEALTLLEQERPDGLIIDLCLPVVDGLTVLQTTPFRPYTILAVTNIVTTQVLSDADSMGIKDIVLIPCSPKYIAERFNTLMQKAPSLEIILPRRG